jgi:5-methylcytosine-specific restriction endonuclease McrA
MSARRRKLAQSHRAHVLLRSDGRCIVCAAPATELHHVLPVESFPAYEAHVENLVGVCERCHALHHDDETRRIPIVALPRVVLTFVYGARARGYLEATYALRDWRAEAVA